MAEIGFPRQDTRAALEHGNMVLTDACNAMVSAAQSLVLGAQPLILRALIAELELQLLVGGHLLC